MLMKIFDTCFHMPIKDSASWYYGMALSACLYLLAGYKPNYKFQDLETCCIWSPLGEEDDFQGWRSWLHYH
jgi:hypothetical protein